MLTLISELRGVEVLVACPGSSPLAVEIADMGIRVLDIDFAPAGFLSSPRSHFRLFGDLILRLRALRPDAVVINLEGNTVLVQATCDLLGIPVVRFSRLEFAPPRKITDAYSWRRARALVCPSDHVRAQLLDWLPQRLHPRVVRMYNPHVAASMPAGKGRQSVSIGGNGPFIGVFGRLHPVKRIEVAIQAFARVRDEIPGTSLIIVGAEDSSPGGQRHRGALEAQAREPSTAGRVHFLGYQRDVEPLIAHCAMVVLSSESESFGRVLVESWSLGVPTIASDVSGCREITLASGGGLLFPVGDDAALSVHMEDLLRHPGRAAALGQSGKAWVESHCSPREYGAKFGALLAKVTRE